MWKLRASFCLFQRLIEHSVGRLPTNCVLNVAVRQMNVPARYMPCPLGGERNDGVVSCCVRSRAVSNPGPWARESLPCGCKFARHQPGITCWYGTVQVLVHARTFFGSWTKRGFGMACVNHGHPGQTPHTFFASSNSLPLV